MASGLRQLFPSRTLSVGGGECHQSMLSAAEYGEEGSRCGRTERQRKLTSMLGDRGRNLDVKGIRRLGDV